jgi:plasmid stabilization system protein ParE
LATEVKRLEWAHPARAAYEGTIARIAIDDVHTASLVEERVARSLALLQANPQLGTPSALVGRRTYAIPNTGHSLTYRVAREKILILRWYRQRQNVPR